MDHGASRVPVSIAYLISVGYIVNAVAAVVRLGEALTAQKLAGLAFIVVGVFLVARSECNSCPLRARRSTRR